MAIPFKVSEAVNLDDPSFYNNRELSWLSFNQRVLEEAMDKRNRLLERYKYLAIFSSNLDEFFMVRVAGILDQVKEGVGRPEDKTGLTPKEQLAAISKMTHEFVEKQEQTYLHTLNPLLAKEKVKIVPVSEVSSSSLTFLETYFDEQLLPILTPMAIDASHPFPMLVNKSLNLAIVLQEKERGNSAPFPFNGEFAIVQIPRDAKRLIELPSESGVREFAFMEQVVAHYIYKLFKGRTIKSVIPFRITRKADLFIHEDGADDLLREIEEELKKRKWGASVRLEVQLQCNEEKVVNFLKEKLEISDADVYFLESPLDLTFLFSFYNELQSTHEHLAYPSFLPQAPQDLEKGENILTRALKGDILLHHPFESFAPVVDFISQAADDPDVLAIKQTLYRVSGDSPIIRSLERAAENGKQVTVLVELKARFDEENNVQWAKELEQAGCHVIFGMIHLKIHSKITLVVRRKQGKIERFVHLGTGNYHDATAKLYTDIGLITANRMIGIDATNFFNYLSGYMEMPEYHYLSVSPSGIRNTFFKLIDQEIAYHRQYGNGYILAKMNALTDKQIIRKFYEASRAGVKIDLIVRGICCLRPGIKDVSETITVRSIVGRFLEHSRIYYFHHNGKEKLFLSSADLMTRNMENRVEILFPILKRHLKKRIKNWLLLMLHDNCKAREQDNNGIYHYVKRLVGEAEVDSQILLVDRVLPVNKNGNQINQTGLPKSENRSFSSFQKLKDPQFF